MVGSLYKKSWQNKLAIATFVYAVSSFQIMLVLQRVFDPMYRESSLLASVAGGVLDV